ncbi:MAG TPA: MFS transporter [Gaiellaceae bacterium]|nr:MFS transporter [Gaiellaceae bacterium]
MVTAASQPGLRRRLTQPGVVLPLALLAGQAGLLVLSPILVEVADDFGVSTAAAGQLRTVTGLVAGLAALAFGRLGRGVPLRDLMLAGAGLLAAGSLLSAAAPTFAVLAAAQVLLGLAVAVLISAGAAAAGEWTAPEDRARVLARTLMGPALAWVVGMPLVGLVAETSWRLAFLVLPLVAAVVVGLALSLCEREVLPEARPLVRLRDLLRERTLRLWAIAELLVMSAWVGTLVYSGALFIESYGTSVAATGLILGLVAIAYLPGNYLAARTGIAPLALLRWTTLGSAVALLLFGTVRQSVGLSVVLFALTAFVSAARTYAGGAFGLAASKHRLAVMGIRGSANQFGYLIGAAAGGIALLLGGYSLLGIVFAALLGVSALLYFSLDVEAA